MLCQPQVRLIHKFRLTLVDVSVHVVLGRDPLLHLGQELHATGAHARGAAVTEPHGRRVCDQDVRARGDLRKKRVKLSSFFSTPVVVTATWTNR